MDGATSGRRPAQLMLLGLAWGVHVLTASGAVLGLLALDAAARHAWRETCWLMALACLIDGVDGTLARWLRVKEQVPKVDGALLDNIVDYLNFALVPAWILFQGGIVTSGREVLAAATILLTSCYQFSQSDAKTDDHFFKGFPSYWNIVVLYLMVSGLDPTTNLRVVLVLGVLVFVPLKYIYPSRTRALRELTLGLAVVWTAMVLAIIHLLPDPPVWLVRLSWFYPAYYLAASLWLNLPGGPPEVEDGATI